MVFAAVDPPKALRSGPNTAWDLLWHQMIADYQKF